jgi:cell division protein FtsX
MLSIYLLVQKNSEKLENLLLIGYSPSRVARPYQLLTIGLNALVLVIALLLLLLIRSRYMAMLSSLFPDVPSRGILSAVVAGLAIFLLVSILNILAIRKKVISLWKRKEK